ncbi:hypothetical protein [Pseudogemmobacter sp. W21_MBD1_M6]|uniref:hypothetical protein n=1 Tax=Pseudogemmobacter sp. W21_MBD1_M6 TaxID=3240271 RepID=UPI003F9A6DC5
MAMTDAQRKKAERQRKEGELRILPDSSYRFLAEPFVEWLERTEGHGDWDSALYHFDAAAMPHPEFDGDKGPVSIDGEVERTRDETYDPYAGYERSIGRAESILDHLLAAASNMAIVVNAYKREEFGKRLKELESADLSDPASKKKAFEDVVRLQKMMERLEKMTTIRLHEWKLKGY